MGLGKGNMKKYKEYDKCNLCPRECGAQRNNNKKGICGTANQIIVARAALHYWEEPCISGEKGSGAVFFGGCNLHCVFCQNQEISCGQSGKVIDESRLAEIFLELMEKGANNINLVTPGHYLPQIISAVEKARNQGMNLPIVYNCGGYEKVDSIRRLEGLVDVYLPDFQYFSSDISQKYSNAKDYAQVAKLAIEEMVRQQNKCVFDQQKIIKKGVIVRHLLLPGCLKDSKKVIRYLYSKYGDNIFISLMSQYTPLAHVQKYKELNRRVTNREYNQLVNYALELGVINGFTQDREVASESFIPYFDETGV